MRVITGSARGRKLLTLEGEDVRPTTDRVKEAVFSVIQFETEGRRFLDLFAGSGQMGIEALSRGAKEAVFVDSAKKSVEIIRKNLASTKLAENAKVVQTDWQSYLSVSGTQFDIAFLDPPYGNGILQRALEALPAHMSKTGVIIAENPLDEEILSEYGEFALDRQYRYGKIKISTFRNKEFLS
ncbi:16S rRNA (guanine(966)-N(2))-methyltransferase RsmD [Ruminococcaceae bacterium P7]|nr:16S rRNA (guanine(966)-N(2))-methyltransferase RsmD [uncultured Ruminococcus sp.]SCX21597.1 16S rRNA (guanine(966)-N(2))-methyltransferase RsmD [Ruminococcaceae bacterium P7]